MTETITKCTNCNQAIFLSIGHGWVHDDGDNSSVCELHAIPKIEDDDVWKFTDRSMNTKMGAIAELWHWSTNYTHSSNPFNAFLDIIGWSAENIGGCLFDWKDPQFGTIEQDYLANALLVNASLPNDVEQWIDQLMALEMGE